jgi:hypothetical protein
LGGGNGVLGTATENLAALVAPRQGMAPCLSERGGSR